MAIGKFEFTEFIDCSGSSSLARAWYNEDTQQLVIRFKTGAAAGYHRISKGTWSEFKEADSRGSFYSRYIRGSNGFIVSPDCLMLVKAPKFNYVLTAVVQTEVTFETNAQSVDQAIMNLHAKYPDAVVRVKEATVKFE